MATVPVKDDSLIEEKPINVGKGWIGIHLCRRGLEYKSVLKDDYKLITFGNKNTILSEETAPAYLKGKNDFSFYKKGIRDGFIYIYDPEDKFWLMYKVTDYKYRLVTESDSEIAKETANQIKKTTKSSFLKLPDKKKYYVAFSLAGWTRDYLNKTVKKAESGNTIFTLIDVAAWKDANKAKSPKSLSADYTFIEDMYELQDKGSSNNIAANIEYRPVNNIYNVGEKQTSKYGKQKILFFTINDTLGVAEDLSKAITRFIIYKERLNTAIQSCVPVTDILSGQTTQRAGSDSQYKALYASATVLYNMLYSKGGGLNQSDHQPNYTGNNGEHKYQSKVQKYKFTKLLAVTEREALQGKYEILRDLFGNTMMSDEYGKEVEVFLTQSNRIRFSGQSLLMEHLKLLSIQPDCYDSDISLNNEKPDDKWRQLIEDMAVAYMKVKNVTIVYSNLSLIKLLQATVVFEELEQEFSKIAPPETLGTKNDTDSQALDQVTDSDTSGLTEVIETITASKAFADILLPSISNACNILSGMVRIKRINNIDVQKGINKLFDANGGLVKTSKQMISDILDRYNKKNSTEIVDRIYNKQSKPNLKTNPSTKKDKMNLEIEKAKSYHRKLFNRNNRELEAMEVEAIELRKNLPKWMKAKEFADGITKIIGVINLGFAINSVLDELTNENKKVENIDMIYYGLSILGNSYEYVKGGVKLMEITNLSVSLSFGLKAPKWMKALGGLGKNIAADVIIFAAECVYSYRLLQERNPKAAELHALSAGFSLLSSIALSVAFSITGVGIVVLVVVAIGLAVAAYFTGERASEKEFDLWQSFLINSIFSNYVEEKTFSSDIIATIDDDADRLYDEIGKELYLSREDIAINNFYYKNETYNLQDFEKMLCLLDEMATCFEVNVVSKPINYSYEGTGNYIIPTSLDIDISYFGVTRFDSVEYFLYIEAFPKGNSSGLVYIGNLNPQRDIDTLTEYGQSRLTLTFNIWTALHTVKNKINEDESISAKLKKAGYLSADGSHITYPSTMTLTFGCRLVNLAEEKRTLKDENDKKRAYLPWEENKIEMFQGFKCRAAIPVPADKRDFSAWYHRCIYTHLVSGVGSMDDLMDIELREVGYDKKEK